MWLCQDDYLVYFVGLKGRCVQLIVCATFHVRDALLAVM